MSLPSPPSRRLRADARRPRRLVALAAVALVGFAFARWRPLPVEASDDGTARATRTYFREPGSGYHDADTVEALLASWADTSENVRTISLGRDRDGRSLTALEFGAPGEPFEERRGVLLVGGIDGVSQAGTESVLRSTWMLIDQLSHLDPGLTFVAIPRGAPESLARRATESRGVGRDQTPVDDDLDGEFDEDGGEDIDGDGHVLEMLLPDADGSWCLSEDARFPVLAGPGDAPRYRRVVEGRDDDGDGRYNEDGRGGIDYDAHFPFDWRGPGADGSGGRWPLEAEVPRRIADLVESRSWALAVLYQGNHGGLVTGSASEALGMPSATDHRLRLAFERTTGRRIRVDDSLVSRGGFADWLRAVVGVSTIEIAAWGPEVVGVDGRPFRARIDDRPGGDDAIARIDRSRGAFTMGRPLPLQDQLWAAWLDDVRGGEGYLDWHPVDLGTGVTGWVGGWEPRTRFDPPEPLLLEALAGIPEFTAELVYALPKLQIEVVEAERVGALLRTRVRVTNRGGLSTAFAEGPDAGAVTVAVEAACDAAILVGEPETTIDALAPGETSREFEWLVRATEGGGVRVHASCRASGETSRTVRP